MICDLASDETLIYVSINLYQSLNCKLVLFLPLSAVDERAQDKDNALRVDVLGD